MTGILIARVIEADGAQLVPLPGKASFPEDLAKVNIRVQGREKIISPDQNTWNEFFLNGPKVSDDFMNLNQYLLK